MIPQAAGARRRLPDDWATALTRSIAQRVRQRRKALKMSARQLSEECERQGFDFPRSTLADLENDRRHSVSVPELLALACALQMSPIDLVYPLETGEHADAQALLDVRDWWRGTPYDPALQKQAADVAVDLSAMADAISGLNDQIAKQQQEFTRKLAEQQKVLDALVAQPGRATRDRGAQQLKMIEALASLRSTGAEVPTEAMWLLERELPPWMLRGTMFCGNGHDVPAGNKFCPECGISMATFSSEDLARLHPQTLRKMCREKGLPDAGSKDELIARLAA